MVTGSQNFEFFGSNTWFLENNRALSKFLYRILHYLISNYQVIKGSVHKSQIFINNASHLN